MEKYMNQPISKNWTEEDIIAEYAAYQGKKAVAKRYAISVSDVTKILKKAGV